MRARKQLGGIIIVVRHRPTVCYYKVSEGSGTAKLA